MVLLAHASRDDGSPERLFHEAASAPHVLVTVSNIPLVRLPWQTLASKNALLQRPSLAAPLVFGRAATVANTR